MHRRVDVWLTIFSKREHSKGRQNEKQVSAAAVAISLVHESESSRSPPPGGGGGRVGADGMYLNTFTWVFGREAARCIAESPRHSFGGILKTVRTSAPHTR